VPSLFFELLERWNSPYINHFTQPDTIIPDPASPQSWDRYAYVNNNPIRYTDPTGHKTCYNTGAGGACEETKQEKNLIKLLDYLDRSVLNKKGNRLKNGMTSLQAMEKVVNRAALIYGSDWDGFLSGTSFVFMGVYAHGAGAMLTARTSGNAGYINGDSGFHADFRDFTSQQVRHFWAGFSTAANPTGNNPAGVLSANIGNTYHEIVQDTYADNDGSSVMDYALTLTAVDIAKQAGNEIQSPKDLVGVLDYRLGPNGPGYTGPLIPSAWWHTPFD
jgi:hypothetical protein